MSKLSTCVCKLSHSEGPTCGAFLGGWLGEAMRRWGKDDGPDVGCCTLTEVSSDMYALNELSSSEWALSESNTL